MKVMGMRSRVAGMLVLLAGLGFAGGCRPDPQVQSLQDENRRLNHIIMKYNEENRELMRQLEAKGTVDGTVEIELRKKERQIEALKEALRNLQSKVKLTKKVESQLELLAERLGGTLVGNRLLLPGDYFFPSGQFELREASRAALKQFYDIMKDENLTLLIVGHTDSDPIRHSKKFGIRDNRHLSVMRALSVMNELKKDGYDEKLMYPSGWGELLPVADNKSADGKARNRRVEIYIDPAASGLMSVMAITDVEPADESDTTEDSAVDSGEGATAEGPVTIIE